MDQRGGRAICSRDRVPPAGAAVGILTNPDPGGLAKPQPLDDRPQQRIRVAAVSSSSDAWSSMPSCTRAGTHWDPRTRAASEAEHRPAVAGSGPHRCLGLDWPGRAPRASRCGRRSCPTSPGRGRDSGSGGTANPPDTRYSARSTGRRLWWQARSHRQHWRCRHPDLPDPGCQMPRRRRRTPLVLASSTLDQSHGSTSKPPKSLVNPMSTLARHR